MAKRKGKLIDGQKTATTDERRDQTRVPARLEIEVPVANLDVLRRAYTDNISQGGLMFLVEPPVTLPGMIEVTLLLPDQRKITLSSEIRHAAPRANGPEIEIGIQFKDLDPSARGLLEAALASFDKRS